MKQILLFAISAILISCQGFKGKQSLSDSGLNKDTIQTKFFKENVAQDSIKILDFIKFSKDTYNQERIIYIDYKFNNADRKRVLTDKLEKHKAEIMIDNSKDSIKNSFVSQIRDLNDTYVSIRKYKHDYCLYYFDIYFSRTITDTSMIFNDMDGITSYRFKNVTKDGNAYIYEFADNTYNIKQIIAKTIDSELKIQVWQRATLVDKNEIMYSYVLEIPAKNISKIPILYTLTNDAVDQSFDKFDELDLEKEFKK